MTYRQIYVHTNKAEREDGTWRVQVMFTNEIPDDSQPNGYRTEWIQTTEYRSETEPQIEHLDFT